jgi:large subunit ribosomal protein L25
MEGFKLSSEYREGAGKSLARKLRHGGKIPAVLYGQKEKPISIMIDEREFKKIMASQWETAIVDLNIHGKVSKECNAIIKDIQQHPATGKILHVDFQHIRRGQKIKLEVPVVLSGNPRGVKEMGGILEHGLRVLNIRCLPRHIPENIEIDVSGLGIQDTVHVEEIIPGYPDFEFLDDPDSTLAIVVPPKVEVEPVVEEVEEEPELIGKGKEEKAEEAEGEEESEKS